MEERLKTGYVEVVEFGLTRGLRGVERREDGKKRQAGSKLRFL